MKENYGYYGRFFTLTAGIGLGSWWSYRTLGWGGFWAWDPVENVSLLPWLASLAALHFSKIKNPTKIIQLLTDLNCLLIFVLSLFATFIVRSGLISFRTFICPKRRARPSNFVAFRNFYNSWSVRLI